MVTRKSPTGASKKLKIKKETLKDLDARRSVKGGGRTAAACTNAMGPCAEAPKPLIPKTLGCGGVIQG